MAGLNLQEVIAFLDDLIFSHTLEQHEDRLMKVLQWISAFGLKVAPSKSRFFFLNFRQISKACYFCPRYTPRSRQDICHKGMAHSE